MEHSLSLSPTYPPSQRRTSGGQGREATDPRRGLTAASPVLQSRGSGELEPRPPNIHLDPSLPNFQPVRALNPALVIGKASLRLRVRQAVSWLGRLGSEG